MKCFLAGGCFVTRSSFPCCWVSSVPQPHHSLQHLRNSLELQHQIQVLLWELVAVPMLQSRTNSFTNLKTLFFTRPAGLFRGDERGVGKPRTAKNLVVYLDEKLSNCGGNDVEGGDSRRDAGGSDSGSDIGMSESPMQHKALNDIT